MPKELFTDKKRLKQILFNLLSNAIKFTFNGGVTLSASYRNNYLMVRVKDTGLGMTKEETNCGAALQIGSIVLGAASILLILASGGGGGSRNDKNKKNDTK